MKKQRFLLFALLFIYSIAIGGIYRHDKKESEYVALGAQPQFRCVGQIFHKGSNMPASCVLISSRYVLTAAHVFVEASYRNDTTKSEGQMLIANKPYDQHIGRAGNYSILFNGREYKCRSVHVYPGYLDSATKGGLDIALVELKEAVKDIAPAVISISYDELHADVTGVGWGVYGRADKPQEIIERSPKKLAGENVVDSIGGYILNNKPTSMFCDFDHPTDTSCNKMGSSVPRPLEYICGGGDSGGGLFRQTKTGWELIGICHSTHTNVSQLMKTGYYGQIMVWMRVSVFAKWIKENE